MEVWVEGGVEVGSKVEDQRFEVRGRGRGGALSQKCQIFAKRSKESNQVVDSIFELKSIHAREVVYKR
jgi:hypothetical protein